MKLNANVSQHRQSNPQLSSLNLPPTWLGLALLLTVLAVPGRAEESKSVDRNPVGTYRLISVDTNPVPCTIQHEGVKLGVKSGVFVFHTNQTCSSTVVFTPPSGSDVSREVNAEYTREGSKLTMKWQGAGVTTGTLQGDRFTMDNEGMMFVYRK